MFLVMHNSVRMNFLFLTPFLFFSVKWNYFHVSLLLLIVSKGLLSSIEYMSSIEDTFQPYVNSGTIRPIIYICFQQLR